MGAPAFQIRPAGGAGLVRGSGSRLTCSSFPMNSLWRQLAIATNWPVLVAVAVLTTIGATSIWAHSAGDASKQITFAVVGLVLLIALQTVNYQILARFAWGFYFAS